MRINAFMTLEPVFASVNEICGGETTAKNIEIGSNDLFIKDYNLDYINIFSYRNNGPAISNTLDIVNIANDSFDTAGKEEVCFGLRIVNNQLTFTNPLFNIFKDFLPSGSRLILFNPVDISASVQWYIDYYNILTETYKHDRSAARQRKRLFCEPNEVLTPSQIEASLNSVINEAEAEFTLANATPYQNFDRTSFLSNEIPVTSNYQVRIINIP